MAAAVEIKPRFKRKRPGSGGAFTGMNEMANSILPLQYAEVRVRGKNIRVPAVEIAGQTIIAKGNWIRVASVFDEAVAEGAPVKNPKEFFAMLKESELCADIFTFFQRPPDVSPKFDFYFEWDNYAAAPTKTFDEWWESLPQEARKNTRRAAKRGVVVKAVPFDDELARGIHKLCNETPVRQGKPFWHYGKDFETVKREHATYPDRSEFIGAYFQNELIGFIKFTCVDKIAYIMHILAMNSHYDKRPLNALITKAVEICAQKHVSYLVYDRYVYGNKTNSSLQEFKRRNGFQQINFPRYYVPLTWKGKIYLALGLHRGIVGLLPAPLLKFLLNARNWFYQRKEKSVEEKEN